MSELAGKSVLDLLWERLDAFVDDLMSTALLATPTEELKGRAYGMAEAIALITNPYHPDIEAVRGEAMGRWEQRQEVRTQNERTTLADRVQRRAERRARRLARNG